MRLGRPEVLHVVSLLALALFGEHEAECGVHLGLVHLGLDARLSLELRLGDELALSLPTLLDVP